MKPQIRPAALALVTVVALGLGSVAQVRAQAPVPSPAQPTQATGTKPQVTSPKRFGSAEEAVQALVAALRAGDTTALIGIFGSAGRALVSSGDPVADRRVREAFVENYDAANKLVARGGAMILHIGNDAWPFPIPLVREGERWQFDTRRGREEILARRIGRNELNTIQVCLAYVDAQREYYAADRKGDGILEYAQKLMSTPGKRDGLYWEAKPDDPPSPLGLLAVRARAEGYRPGKGGGSASYHGYLYRILTAQGPDAPDGAYDYIVRGHMMAGFGLVAFPAEYGASGVMTFIVNHDGVVYQKDLGPTTRSVAAAMRTFNPDQSWTKVDTAP